MSERERLEALRGGMMALRVPLLVLGVLAVGWSFLGFAYGGINLIISVLAYFNDPPNWQGQAFLIASAVLFSVSALLDLVMGGLLVGISGLGMTSRGAPARLATAARLLQLVWGTLLLRIIGALGVFGGYLALEFLW